MYNKIFFIISFCFLITSCDGQKINNTNCEISHVIDIINALPEVQKQSKFVDAISQNKKKLSFMTDTLKINDEQYYQIKTGFNGKFHWETYTIFYINKSNCTEIMVDEVISGDIIPLEKWRILNQKTNTMDNSTTSKSDINFQDLFNEGTIIKFTPKDLDKNDPEIIAFKQKLDSYENNNSNKVVNESDLSILINNETFFDAQYFTDSNWLQYFITKYNINTSVLNNLMRQAIMKEDYNAVRILIDNGYIISNKDLQILSDVKKESKNKALENKTDGYESYLVSKSKINEISELINKSYSKNHIKDPDGYTNLRQEKSSSSQILQKIKSEEEIDVLDNTGDWWFVQTIERKQGYVHKSRIVNK